VSRTSTSAGEREVRDFVESLGFETKHGYIPGNNTFTYDVIVPEQRVVVEYNGVYWHSYPRTQRGMHYQKRRHAESCGHRMITLWEDHWKGRRARMESLLRRALTGGNRSIGARKTTVEKLQRFAASGFHESYHVQPFAVSRASEHYALLFEGEVVAVASFEKAGVLHRYTIKDGLSLPGGLRKLIAAFRKEHGVVEIVTYCDRDHFSGSVYRNSGFEHTGGTLQMSYVEGGVRVRREKYMKHKLKKVLGLDAVPADLKEIDICAEHGVFAVWNSGVDRYVLR
jgi:hypothetical protein